MSDKYYVICLEEKSNEGSLLFWKPLGRGYTANLGEAGMFNEDVAKDINLKGRDVALTKDQLRNIPFSYRLTIVNASFLELIDFKNNLKEEKK